MMGDNISNDPCPSVVAASQLCLEDLLFCNFGSVQCSCKVLFLDRLLQKLFDSSDTLAAIHKNH